MARLALYNTSNQIIWDSSTVEGGILITKASLAAAATATLSFPDFPGATADVIVQTASKIDSSNSTSLGVSVSNSLGYPVITKVSGSYDLEFTVMLR
jgi:hypothetical protein